MSEVLKDIIEFDSDTEMQDEGNDGSLYPYDPTYNDIEMSESPFTVFEFIRKYDNGKIITQPDFQRNLVWTNVKKSRFIESIILNFPLPPIYLNETIDGNYMIIDGLQRTTTIHQFYKGDFELNELQALPKYNGSAFSNLPDTLQSKFEDKKLTIFILKPSTPMVVIYDLFNRINTGGTQLNRQEVRNCIYIGKCTRLLKELSEKDYFKNAIDWGIKETRMKDREAVLRYLAFRWFNYKKEYTGDMSNYIETAMKIINQLDDRRIENMETDFKRVMEFSYKIWGNKNFRIPTEYTRGTINIAILESVGNYLATRTNNFLEKNKKIIRKNYTLLIENNYYYEAVTRATGNKNKVFERFELAHEILNLNTND
jgi:hypothetical protein